MTEIYM